MCSLQKVYLPSHTATSVYGLDDFVTWRLHTSLVDTNNKTRVTLASNDHGQRFPFPVLKKRRSKFASLISYLRFDMMQFLAHHKKPNNKWRRYSCIN